MYYISTKEKGVVLNMNTKRIISMLIAFTLVITILPGTAFAAGGPNSQENPYTDITDHVNFPVYPGPGSVKIDKSAAWVKGSDRYAQVKLDITSIPPTSGADLVVLFDTSSSMEQYGSNCLNPDHYTDFTYTKSVSYYAVTKVALSNVTPITDELTITGHAHVDDDGVTAIESYSITGLRTVSDGHEVTAYRMQHGDERFFATDMKEHRSAAAKLFFCRAFEDLRFEFGNRTMTMTPVSDYPLLPNPYQRDMNGGYIGNRAANCFFRIDVAQDAAIRLAKTMFDNEGDKSSNRIGVIPFNNQATVLGNKFFTSSDSDITELNGLINGISIPENQGTKYAAALDAAKNMIESRPAAEQARPAFVLFVSDGAPDYVTHPTSTDSDKEKEHQVIDAVTRINPVINGMFSVGIGLTEDAERDAIKLVVKAPGININVADDASLLVPVFLEIAQLTKDASDISVIADTIGDAFDLVPNSDDYPWVMTSKDTVDDDNEITVNAITTKSIGTKSIGSENNKITWKPGYLPKSGTLTYFIKVKDGTLKGTYPVSKASTITYINHQNNWAQQAFPIPQLIVANDIPGGGNGGGGNSGGGNNGGGTGTTAAPTTEVSTTEDDIWEPEEPEIDDADPDNIVEPSANPQKPSVPKTNAPVKNNIRPGNHKYPNTGDTAKYLSGSFVLAAFSAIILIQKRRSKKQL